MDLSSPPQTWVVKRQSADQAALAFLWLTLRGRRWWAFVAAVEVLMSITFFLAIDGTLAPVARLVWGVVFAVVPTIVLCCVSLGIAHLLNRRRMGQRMTEGAVLESAFSEGRVALRGPWTDATISFDGIASLRSSGDWIFLRQVGSPVETAWPKSLFPDEDRERLLRHLAARPS